MMPRNDCGDSGYGPELDEVLRSQMQQISTLEEHFETIGCFLMKRRGPVTEAQKQIGVDQPIHQS
jgi:hypothetical protein